MEAEFIPCLIMIGLFHVCLGRLFHSAFFYISYICLCSDFGASVVLVQPRPMVPKKDIAVYGYGSVAWKDRLEDWKKRQNDKLQVVKHEGNNNGGNFGDDLEDPDMPM